jgi:transketolase
MRNAFAKKIEELAGQDERVVLLMGDIGNRMFNSYRDKYPSRFFNAGVAEANMVTMAAGMAAEGLRPFCYTIAPFLTSRAYEQIKVDLGYHHLPVVLVGTGAGLSYASLGATHHSLEDIGILRTVPGLNIFCPGDSLELEAILPMTLDLASPSYLRIGKKGEPAVHSSVPSMEIGKNLLVQEGEEVCLLSTGNLLPVAVDVAGTLEKEGHSVRVESLPTLVPLDRDGILRVLKDFPVVATMEEHGRNGGLGEAVSSLFAAEGNLRAKLLRFDAGDAFLHKTCNQAQAREYLGLTTQNMVATISPHLNSR